MAGTTVFAGARVGRRRVRGRRGETTSDDAGALEASRTVRGEETRASSRVRRRSAPERGRAETDLEKKSREGVASASLEGDGRFTVRDRTNVRAFLPGSLVDGASGIAIFVLENKPLDGSR